MKSLGHFYLRSILKSPEVKKVKFSDFPTCVHKPAFISGTKIAREALKKQSIPLETFFLKCVLRFDLRSIC